MASQKQQEENLDEENDLLLSSQDDETPPGTQTPILIRGPAEITDREDLLVSEIDKLIRQFLLRPNHQSPYSFAFQWVVNTINTVSYSVTLTIDEPASL